MLLFSQQPFTTDLINSNRKWFRYEWIWRKPFPAGFLNANRMPLRAHENVLVFYEHLPTYNPQKIPRAKPQKQKTGSHTSNYGSFKLIATVSTHKFPTDVVEFATPLKSSNHYHPTQKPTDLLAYMIKTYTDEGDTVLDSTMGSGSTGVACRLTGRNFIGIEKDPRYFAVAQKRLTEVK